MGALNYLYLQLLIPTRGQYLDLIPADEGFPYIESTPDNARQRKVFVSQFLPSQRSS